MYTDDDVRHTVGLRDVSSAVFIKQYGERRTSTNVLRALITHNFTNVFVLMHILGDKHEAPADLKRIRASLDGSADAAWRFVTTATYDTPSETTQFGHYLQVRFMRALHEGIFRAYEERRLFYLISVRNPYTWASGFLRFLGWPEQMGPETWDHGASADILATACRRSNDKHRAWLALHQEAGGNSMIVQGERMRRESIEVLHELERAMALPRRVAEFELIPRTVDPTHWDYTRSRTEENWFDFRPRLSGVRLTEALHDVVTRGIDWTVMRHFGYEPEVFTPSPPRGGD